MRNFHFPGRSLVYGRRAMCATSHPMASLTAIEVLKEGGNAVDAAIATAAVLAVVEPHMTGIGGDCFALVPSRASASSIALNAAGRAPAGATADWLAKAASRASSPPALHAVTVPGAVDGWCRLLDDHGTMPLARLLAARHRSRRARFRRCPARCGRLGAARAAHLQPPRRQAASLQGGRRAEGGRGHAVSGAGAHAQAHRPRGTRRLLRRRGGRGHRGRAQRAGRTAHAGRLRGPAIDLCGADLGDLSRRRALRAAAQQPRHRRADHAQDAGAAPACRRSRSRSSATTCRSRRPGSPLPCATPSSPTPTWPRCRSSTCWTMPSSPSWLAASTATGGATELGPLPQPPGSDTVYFAIVDEKGMAVSLHQLALRRLRLRHRHSQDRRRASTTAARASSAIRRIPTASRPASGRMHTLVPAMVLKDGHAADGVRRDGRALPAHGPRLRHEQHVPLRHGPAGGASTPRACSSTATASWSRRRCRRRSLPASKRWATSCRRTRRCPGAARQIVMIDRARGVLIGASDPRKDGMALGY